jgi:hypothetical protein
MMGPTHHYFGKLLRRFHAEISRSRTTDWEWRDGIAEFNRVKLRVTSTSRRSGTVWFIYSTMAGRGGSSG